MLRFIYKWNKILIHSCIFLDFPCEICLLAMWMGQTSEAQALLCIAITAPRRNDSRPEECSTSIFSRQDENRFTSTAYKSWVNLLNAELNSICHLLVLLGDLTFMGTCIVSIFQYISNKMQRYTVYLHLETALHVSYGTSTHHQEGIQMYLQHLVFVTPLLLSAAIVEELEPVWVCCGWRTSWTPDDWRKDCSKHVESYSINSKIVPLSWFYYRNISRCSVPWTSNLCYTFRSPRPPSGIPLVLLNGVPEDGWECRNM
jgi:hypothetical protein